MKRRLHALALAVLGALAVALAFWQHWVTLPWMLVLLFLVFQSAADWQARSFHGKSFREVHRLYLARARGRFHLGPPVAIEGPGFLGVLGTACLVAAIVTFVKY